MTESATINWHHDTELEVEITWGADVQITPSGRIDWTEEYFPIAESVTIEDKKGRKWELAHRMDSDELDKLAENKIEEAEQDAAEAKYERLMDAEEARWEDMY